MRFVGYRWIAKPVGEVEVKVAVAVGAAGGGSVADGESGGVGLVGGIAVKRGSRKVFDINNRTTTGGVRVVLDIVFADGIVRPAAVENGSEHRGGVTNLIFKAVVFFVASGGIGATVAGRGAVLAGVRPRVGN